MKAITLNNTIPDFTFTATSGVTQQLSDLKGQKIILYFYPKDCTSGCTQEGLDFSEHFKDFKKLNAVIFGISRESLKSHEKFKAEQAFPFELISDTNEQLCQLFNVMKEKSMYGKKYMGIERSTFIIDEQGLLIHEWRGVKVPGHVQEVLNFLKKA
jgi:peroxiredoxin Q/BCP